MKFFPLLLFSFAASCGKNDAMMTRDFSNAPTSTAFSAGQKTGVIQGDFVKELSGIAASSRHPGGYWVHSDGAKATEIYLIDSLGNRLATCQLPGVLPQDCEDIAIGPGSETGVSYIYLADLPIDKATAGDVSPDGTEVLLKNKREILYWKAQNGMQVCDLLLKTDPQRVPYLPEIQGEAICFNVGATGFLTSTERAKAMEQPIYYFSKK